METDLLFAQACVDSYDPNGKWDEQAVIKGVWISFRIAPEYVLVTFRGSQTPEDWLRDFRAVPWYDKDVGWCEQGFLQGMQSVVDLYLPALKAYKTNGKKIYVTGHSLGAARSLIFAGKSTVAGCTPDKVVVCGCPKPGLQRLSDIIVAGAYPCTIYQNGSDPVTDVPYWLGKAVRPYPETAIKFPVTGITDPFQYHHMPYYYSGIHIKWQSP